MISALLDIATINVIAESELSRATAGMGADQSAAYRRLVRVIRQAWMVTSERSEDGLERLRARVQQARSDARAAGVDAWAIHGAIDVARTIERRQRQAMARAREEVR